MQEPHAPELHAYVTVALATLAPHVAVVHPDVLAQVQDQGPLQVTIEAVPAEQSPEVGAEVTDAPFADQQAPFTAVEVQTVTQFLSNALVKPWSAWPDGQDVPIFVKYPENFPQAISQAGADEGHNVAAKATQVTSAQKITNEAVEFSTETPKRLNLFVMAHDDGITGKFYFLYLFMQPLMNRRHIKIRPSFEYG